MGIGNIKNIKQPLYAAVFAQTAVERVEDDIGAWAPARQQDPQVAPDTQGGHAVAAVAAAIAMFVSEAK